MNMKISKLEIISLLLLFAYILISMYGRANAVMDSFDVADESYNDYTKIIIVPFIGLTLFLIFQKKYDFSNGFNILFVVWLFVIAISNYLFIPIDRFISYSLQQTIWILSSYLFYNIGKNYIKPFYIAVCVSCICAFMAFCVYNELYILRNFVAIASKVQVNEIYFLLCMLPWVMLIEGNKLKFIRIILLFIILWFTVFSMKRAAIIGLGAFLLFYFYGLLKQEKLSGKNFFLLLLICIIGVITFNVVDEMYGGHLSYRMESMESDGGSGRLDLYSMIISSLDDFNLINWLIGAGRGAIKDVAEGHSAHNEYLEVFYSWGLVGLCIYVSILINFFKKLKNYIESEYYPICMGSIGMFVSMSMVTHFVINPYLMCILTSFWGYMIAKSEFDSEYDKDYYLD